MESKQVVIEKYNEEHVKPGDWLAVSTANLAESEWISYNFYDVQTTASPTLCHSRSFKRIRPQSSEITWSCHWKEPVHNSI